MGHKLKGERGLGEILSDWFPEDINGILIKKRLRFASCNGQRDSAELKGE